jgi:hypothetical protein
MDNNDITSKFNQDFSDGELYSVKTEKTPLVAFKDNELYIQGSSIIKDSKEFYAPIIDNMAEMVKKSNIHTINIDMDYFDIASAHSFYDMFRILEKANKSGKIQPTVNWFYNSEDKDMHEAGEGYGSLVEIPFKLFER